MGAIEVVVPTYRRPELLRGCLHGLMGQRARADRVLVVVRRGDGESGAVVREFGSAGVMEVTVDAPGVVAALRRGVATTRADLVAFTDDDAVPRPDWLERITAAFTDPSVGAVGGRYDDGTPVRPGVTVGRINRVGRLVGNHATGTGAPRDVDVLTGANMAFRADVLALPAPGVLEGTGAEPHYEVLAAAYVRSRGLRVVYDPSILVDHRPTIEQLPDGDLARDRESPSWTAARAHNWLVTVTAFGARSPWLVAAYGLGIGMRPSPGVIRAGAALVRGEREVVRRFPASVRGQRSGLRRARIGGALTVPATVLRQQAGSR
ncbi:MAG: hypothetical protein AMXMBFR46_02180 [Acidimicrobiia bacterium]